MFHANQNFDLLRYTHAVPAGGVCASFVICMLMSKYVGRCLDSSVSIN